MRCKSCGDDHPLTEEHWIKRGDNKTKWRARCKSCLNADRRRIKKAKTAQAGKAAGIVGRKRKAPPEVRVVEDKYGQRRALKYWELEPPDGWKMIGIGSYLLNLADGRAIQ